MKISVIMPCYNCQSSVVRTVQSIQAQTFEDWELIAVDDGSLDETGKLLDMLALQDRRISVIHQANGGVSRARNAGMAAAQGEWLAFVDADDCPMPEMMETLLSLNTGKEDILCAAHRMHHLDEEGREEKIVCADGDRQTVLESLIRGDSALNTMWDKLYRADFVREKGLLVPPDIRIGEDVLFNLEAFFAAKAWKMTDIPLYVYECGGNSAMTAAFSDVYAKSKPMLYGITCFIQKYGLETELFRAHIDIYLRILRKDRGRFRAALAFNREIVRRVTGGVDVSRLCVKQKVYALALRMLPCLSYFLP